VITSIENQLVEQIIKEQELIIGPMAWEEASKVAGLRIDVGKREVHIEGNAKQALENLVAQYEKLFGLASREVCRDAVRPLLSQVPQDEIPAILK
jgi:hypothetical protein